MLSKRLSYLRKQNNKTQKEVASYIGVTRPAYTAYETGKRQPDNKILVKLATYFDVTTDYLLGKSDDPNKTEDEEFETFIKDPDLRRWFKELPKSDEEDLARLKRIWEAYKYD